MQSHTKVICANSNNESRDSFPMSLEAMLFVLDKTYLNILSIIISEAFSPEGSSLLYLLSLTTKWRDTKNNLHPWGENSFFHN